jgi:glycosyltransferase involved in cell wall biosynthesis
MNAIQVSIIFPVFNAESYLRSSLTSLLNQTETSLEIIAVDDGSTDLSLELLQHAAQQDSRIIVVSQANRGLSAARNRGIEQARGRWIAFVDSDDWLDPRALETWRQQAEQQQLDFVIGNGFVFSADPAAYVAGNAKPLLQRQTWGKVLSGRDWIVHSIGVGEWRHFAWLQFIRREFLDRSQTRFIEGIVHEDILWTLQLAPAAQRIGFCAAPFYGYRINPQSITNDLSLTARAKRAQSYLLIMDRLAQTADSQSADRVFRRALQRHNNKQSKNFLKLMHRKIDDPAIARELWREFSQRRLGREIFKGASNPAALWRALRCWSSARKFDRESADHST